MNRTNQLQASTTNKDVTNEKQISVIELCFRVNVPEFTHHLLCFVSNVISSTAGSYGHACSYSTEP